MTSERKPALLPRQLVVRAADRARMEEETIRHPMNPRSEVHALPLSRRVGLDRIGVNLLRVPAGKESFAPHVHHTEEEFVFVLSGKGVAEIGGEVIEVGPGDFLGFPVDAPAHVLRNTGGDELVYLAGGENHEVEISDFPQAGKRLVRIGKEGVVYPLALGEPFFHG